MELTMLALREGDRENTLQWCHQMAQGLANESGVNYVIFERGESSVNRTASCSPYFVRGDSLSKWEADPKNQAYVVNPQ